MHMLGSTITLSINAVNKVLVRVDDSEPYSSKYFLEDGDDEYTLKFTHTVPKSRGASKESHLVRLDVDTYDSDDVLVRRQSVWTVMEASSGRQDATTLGYYAQGLMTWLGTNKALILARDS
jgi:bifunctional ADP-heptose synthase (sugar kinase/adenylyltransferase)